MTYEEAKQDFEFWTERAAYKQKQIDGLINKYGTGVRPSWVSADLAIDRMWLDEAKKKAEYAEYVMMTYEARQEELADKWEQDQ